MVAHFETELSDFFFKRTVNSEPRQLPVCLLVAFALQTFARMIKNRVTYLRRTVFPKDKYKTIFEKPGGPFYGT